MREAPRRPRRLDEHATRTGRSSTRRSGCPHGYVVRARRLARRRPLARLHRPLLAARDEGLLRRASSGPAYQPWSNGKVGLNGISYYAMNQWQVAALQPPHLAAMCVVGGRRRLVPRRRPTTAASSARSGPTGTTCRSRRCSTASARTGRGARSPATRLRRRDADRRRSWPRNRADFGERAPRAPARRRATTPSALAGLSTGSTCRCSRPATGAATACTCAATSRASCGPRRRRSGSRCTGSSTGRTSTPTTAASCSSASSTTSSRARTTAGTSSRRVQLQVRHVGRHLRACAPRTNGRIARTRVDEASTSTPDGRRSRPRPPQAPATVAYDAHGRRRHVHARRRSSEETEITGPIAAKLCVSSSTVDADLFLVAAGVRSRTANEVIFQGALDPHTPIAQGWLRASHRKLDAEAHAAVPALPHARRGPAARPRRGLRARRRDLADLHRDPGRLHASRSRAGQGLRVPGAGRTRCPT